MAITKLIQLASVLTFIIIITACTTEADQSKLSQNHYKYSADSNTRLAEDYRSRGIDYMAEYHDNEAKKARHNEYASDCGFFDFIFIELLLNGDACERK